MTTGHIPNSSTLQMGIGHCCHVECPRAELYAGGDLLEAHILVRIFL